MKYVVDANVLFSALYDMDSNAGRLLLMAIEGNVELVSTEHVQSEMRDILASKLGYSREEVEEALRALPVEWMERGIYEDVLPESLRVLSDEADASLLACALTLDCEVVTGDKEVLSNKFRGVKVRKLRSVIQ